MNTLNIIAIHYTFVMQIPLCIKHMHVYTFCISGQTQIYSHYTDSECLYWSLYAKVTLSAIHMWALAIPLLSPRPLQLPWTLRTLCLRWHWFEMQTVQSKEACRPSVEYILHINRSDCFQLLGDDDYAVPHKRAASKWARENQTERERETERHMGGRG